MAATAIRGKDWVFNAFWAACGESNSPKCSINIPITFIFNSGKPTKTLNTDQRSGYIKRIILEDVVVERTETERGLRGDNFRTLRVIRQLLLEFSDISGYTNLQDQDDPFVCKVFYSDGQVEDLSMKTLDVLMRNETWRMQVLLIQGYVHTLSIQTGNFSITPKVRSKLDDSSAETADQYTKAIAKYSEKAYALSSEDIFTRSSSAAELKSVPLKVVSMTCKFALDCADRVVFLYADYTAVEIENGRREVEEYISQERTGRETSAALSVSREMYTLLKHAQQRGLGLEESFGHFDTQKSGYVDVDKLIEGLALLGIGVTYPVGEALLQIVGGIGAHYMTQMDFERFLSAPTEDVDMFARMDTTAKPQGSGTARKMTAAAGNKAKSSTASRTSRAESSARDATLNQLLPPARDDAPLGATSGPKRSSSSSSTSQFMDIQASQQMQWEDILGDDEEGAIATKGRKGKSRQQAMSSSMELPLPEAAYSTVNPLAASRSTTELPTWAAKRSHKALKELRTSQQRASTSGTTSVKKRDSLSVDGSETSSVAKKSRAKTSGSPKATSKSASGNSISRAKVQPLSLVGLSGDLAANSRPGTSGGPIDEQLLHVDHGVIMTYRLLQGTGQAERDIKTHEEADALRYRSILEMRERNLHIGDNIVQQGEEPTEEQLEQLRAEEETLRIKVEAQERRTKMNRDLTFTLVVVPDLFTTLDTLQGVFQVLLAKYPFARLLLVGLPGLPNTTWPQHWVLNSDLQARSIAKLLQHLLSKGLVNSDRAHHEPIFFMGIGTGAFTLSRFVALYLPELPEIYRQIRGVVSVNGMLRYSKKFKGQCKDLRAAMSTAGSHEANELITSLHFHDEYLAAQGRERCLDKFWSTRRGLHMSTSLQQHDQEEEEDRAGLGYVGVLEQLRGILITPDDFDGAQMLLTNIPLVVVQSTEDVFVDPKNAAVFRPQSLPPERHLVNDLADCLDANAVHVVWLKAGHELLQERTSYLLSLISNLAQICGINPILEQPVATVADDDGDMFDVLELAAKRKRSKAEMEAAAARGSPSVLNSDGIDEGEEEEEDDEEPIEFQYTPDMANAPPVLPVMDAQSELEAQIRADEAQKRTIQTELQQRKAFAEKKAAEKLKRSQLAVERRKREMRMSRQNHMEILYIREREELDRKNELRETVKMIREDKRSRYAAEYLVECEIATISAQLAKVKADELARYRREEAIKRVEEQMARKRAERIEERRRKAEDVVKNIQKEELTLSGMREGGYEMPKDVSVVHNVIESSSRILKDLLECRQKSVEAMKRQITMQEKTELFRKQLASVENEERRLRRAIRMIEINPGIVGDDLSAAYQLEELKRSLLNKQETLTELSALSRQREAQLDASNKSVQLLKMASIERDKLMSTRIKELHQLEANLTKRARDMKMNRENLVVRKDRLRIQQITVQTRADGFSREIFRIKDHKGKLIDSDVMLAGVMQRSQTKELRKQLAVDLKIAEDKSKEVLAELNGIRAEIFGMTEIMAKVKRDCDKITGVTKVLFKMYQKFSAVSVVDIMKNLADAHQKADKLETRRTKETDIERLFSKAGSDSLLDKVRLKDSDIRTRDERQFVGIDLVMCPEAYLHLSVVEAEQMQFDDDYQCTLSKTDLERVMKLPEQISLALPFLHTTQEVNAHRLMNMFLRNKDDNFFRNKDYNSYSGANGAASASDDASLLAERDDPNTLVTKKDMKDAEVVHDILLRESLRDRIRSSVYDDILTEDEQKWLAVDKILSPHVFDASEQIDAGDTVLIRTVENTLSSSLLDTQTVRGSSRQGTPSYANKRKKKIDTNRDGEIYAENRADFDAGIDIFDYNWQCPFSRSELLALRKLPVDQLRTADQLEVRALVDKYYVDDNESVLGHVRLKTLNQVTSSMAKVIQFADEKADDELEALYAAQAENADGESVLTAGSGESSKHLGSTKLSRKTVSTKTEQFTVATKRVWGSWNQVHPASAGKESQTTLFQSATFDAARDHPASFAMKDDAPGGDDELTDDEDEGEDSLGFMAPSRAPKNNAQQLQSIGMHTLTSLPSGALSADPHRNDPSSDYFITDSVSDLSKQDARKLRGKIVLILHKDPLILFDVKDNALQARQSRSHYFTLPDRDNIRALDITVSVIFQGDFSNKGYKLGRLAAGLFRLPTESKAQKESAPGMPIPVGYSPYAMQSPNLPTSMGRLVIIHRPKVKPLKPGTFQIVIGSASATKYSIEVSCKYGQAALPLVDEAVNKARAMQMRLPKCLLEVDSIEESLRLAERKLLVCEKMIQEAESETERCQKGIRKITQRLERDDEDMGMMEDERRNFQRELGILEVEYAQWAGTFATRNQERDDIKGGIAMMYRFQKDRLKEKDTIKADLERERRELPSCICILRNMAEAANVAQSLNTSVQGISDEVGAAATGDFGGIQVSTPAEDVRRQIKQFGMKSLLLEEHQWCLLDQAVNPHKYEWLRELEEKEAAERELMGKPPKKAKFNAALEAFKLSKSEVEYTMVTPFSMLTRREMIVRKLLTKYHDDSDHLKKAISAMAYSFDPHLAEKVRGKHPRSYSKEEREWSTVDRKLHPEVWKYYVNRDENLNDRHTKDSELKIDLKGKSSRKSDRDKRSARNSGVQSKRAVQESVDTSMQDQTTETTPSVSPSHNAPLIASHLADLMSPEFAERLQQNNSKLVARKKVEIVVPNGAWQCPFDRDTIMRIWRTPRHNLKSDDERNVFKLLQKYNGAYTSYMDALAQAKKRSNNMIQEGVHIQWEKLGKLVSKDVDERARQILREIDRATFTKNEWLHSDVLHASDQKFPTKVLRMHLEEALDVLLSEQIKDRERAEKMRVDSSDSEDDDEADLPVTTLVNGEEDLSDDGSGGGDDDSNLLDKVKRRAKRRERRKKRVKQASLEHEVLEARKAVNATKKKSSAELAEAMLANQLGVMGCLACRSAKCRWRSSVDIDTCTQRKNVLDRELERVRLDRDSLIFESDVCLSAQLGGNRVFKRADLTDELVYESRELERRLDLNNVDMELHDAFAARTEYFESKHLHGYSILLWTNNARKALDARQSRLCALSVAKEAIDDILDWMLEGWYFGERESQFNVLGYVPSIKKDGKIRAGQDQISSVTSVIAKMKKRADARRMNVATAETTRGQMIEKAWEVELNSQQNLKVLKVARDGNAHEHLLNETESTLRFGIFMLTLMYFRAMTFLKREQKSWSDEGDEIGIQGKGKAPKVMTDERLKMIDEENKAIARKKKVDIVLARSKVGEARRREREAAERREAIIRLQAVVRRQKLELDSVCGIQKVYRGHIGRKAAKRWALKRAELGAMNALLNATAICLQRVYRGYLARCFAITKRIEMSQFIALMRVQESQQDEEIYWQTHPWSRFKRNRKDWYAQKMEAYRQRSVLGGSRLSAAEQAELEGKTLEDIRREIEGLGDEHEEGEGGDEDRDVSSSQMNYISEGTSGKSEYDSGKVSGRGSVRADDDEGDD